MHVYLRNYKWMGFANICKHLANVWQAMYVYVFVYIHTCQTNLVEYASLVSGIVDIDDATAVIFHPGARDSYRRGRRHVPALARIVIDDECVACRVAPAQNVALAGRSCAASAKYASFAYRITAATTTASAAAGSRYQLDSSHLLEGHLLVFAVDGTFVYR